MRSGLGEGYHPNMISPPSPNFDLTFFSFLLLLFTIFICTNTIKIPCHGINGIRRKTDALIGTTITVNTYVSSHSTLILLMAFLNLPLLLRCLLVAFAILLAKKGPELRVFLLSNERFGGGNFWGAPNLTWE